MKKEYYKSSDFLIYAAIVFIVVMAMLSNFPHKPLIDLYQFIGLGGIFLLGAYAIEKNIFIKIEDGRRVTNSGYFDFRRDKFDILDIRYIYRHSEFIVKWYGSRMVFFIKMPDGKLRQSALREQAYSNDTIIALLKRLKQIRPPIELDPEYEKILAGQMFIDDMSENTVSSIEARLKAKGERW
jgi:hypothetical protein